MERFIRLLQNPKRKQLGELFFFGGLSIELFFMLYNLGAYGVPEWLNVGRFMQAAFILFGCKVLCTHYTKKEWLAIVLLAAFGIISYYGAGREEWVLRVIMLVIASKNEDSKKVAKFVFYFTLIGSLFIIVMSLLGAGAPMMNVKDYGRNGAESGILEIRWTFGMGHPNHTHGFFCFMVTLLLYLYAGKTKWYQFVLLTIFNIGLYMLTVSRAGVLITQFVICAVWAVRYWKPLQNPKVWLILGEFCVIGTVVFILYASLHGVEGPIMSRLDQLFTGRLIQIEWYGDPQTWSLFSPSQDIGRAVIDVAYAAMINAYGYAVFTLYIITVCLLIVRCYQQENIVGMIVIMSSALYATMENYINSYFLMYNVVLVVLCGNWNHLLYFKGRGKRSESI